MKEPYEYYPSDNFIKGCMAALLRYAQRPEVSLAMKGDIQYVARVLELAAKMEDALKWYANDCVYMAGSDSYPEVLEDRGVRAKVVLGMRTDADPDSWRLSDMILTDKA